MIINWGKIGKNVTAWSIAILCGWLGFLSGIPFGWMIGAMVGVSIASFWGLALDQPVQILNVTRAAIGTMLGAAVTLETLISFQTWWVSIVVLLVALASMLTMAYIVLRKLFRFDAHTSALCSIPGGIAELILLADNTKADQTKVAVVHALRISMTVISLPLIVFWFTDLKPPSRQITPDIEMEGWGWLWFLICVALGFSAQWKSRIPAPLILVPMIVSGLIHIFGISDFQVPQLFNIVIQVLIGMSVGKRLTGVDLTNLGPMFFAAFVVVVAQVGVSVAAAFMVSLYFSWDFLTVVIAYAPGGLAEMSLIALALNSDVAMIGTHHLLRVSLALVLAPFALQLLTSKT